MPGPGEKTKGINLISVLEKSSKEETDPATRGRGGGVGAGGERQWGLEGIG